MIQKLLGHTDEPNKLEVIIHVGAAFVAVCKAYDRYVTYKSINSHQGAK